MKTSSLGLAFSVTLIFAAAPARGQDQTPSDPTTSGPTTREKVTFTEHVAGIIFNNCTRCHRPDNIAPFPLTNYKEVRKRARMIQRVVEDRIMPPWLPVKGHGEFEDTLRMDQKDVDTIIAWVKGGRVEGNSKLLPEMPDFPSGWNLGEPDLVVSMPKAFSVPASGRDIYRNFVVPVGLDEDKWLTAIEVRPSARAVLHHAIFAMDTSGDARRRDGADGKPGFSGMRGGGGFGRGGSRGGSAGIGQSTSGLGGWAVGGQARHLPMGLARKLPKGADIVLQSHLHPSGKRESEKTTLGLYFTDKAPARTAVGIQMPPMFGIRANLNVPAGESNFTIRDSFVLPVDAQVLTAGGHAHMICKDMHIWATLPSGEKKSIFWIDNWLFDWQNRYQYRQPLDLPEGTKIDAVVTYDNSANNPSNPNDPPKRIRWGLQSTDEMGSVTMLCVAKREADSRELKNAYNRHVAEHFTGGSQGGGLLSGLAGMMASRIKDLDKNNDGKVEPSEIPERYKRFVTS
ncbi:MAG: hypothetical protein QF412_01225, partial [Planctomycetota bacterium]|nr:hypothetical protein [Planctomycetota bacterium]